MSNVPDSSGAVAENGSKPKKKWYSILMKYMFSHIGLCILLAVYCVLGALIFMAIEGKADEDKVENRRLRANQIVEERKAMVDEIKNYALPARVYSFGGSANPSEAHDKYSVVMKSLLATYVKNVTSAHSRYGYDGTIHQNPEYAWSFPSSVLFSVSIVTLIGFGHVFPVSVIGQLVVIVYSLFGIPLMLMFLANIGEVLANGIRSMYAKGFCHVCVKNRKFHHEKCVAKKQKRARPRRRHTHETDDNILDDEEEEKEDPSAYQPVPISLTCGLIGTYLLFGTAFFYAIESKWSMLQSGYFCFTTLSTIGFGDLVPGWSDMGSAAGKFKLAGSALYIMLGLAFLSMGFSLMVDQLLDKFKCAGKRMGVVDPIDDKDVAPVGNLSNAVRRPVFKP